MGYKYNPLLKVGLDEVGAGGSASAAGSDTQIQYNNSGAFGASADLTWDDTAKELGVGGDITLDDGGTYATTLQLITPTANRTISLPDATGTVGLVAGSSGQLVYNNAGLYSGAPSTSVGATGNITLSLNGAADTPPLKLTGTWFSGGTGTTTKPQFLIEPTGTTSTAWSTSGTGLGVNAPSGFTGNLLDLQVDGTRIIGIAPGAAGAVYGTRINLGAAYIENTSQFSINIVPAYGVGGLLVEHDAVITKSDRLGIGNGFVILNRDANDVLAQRRSTNAQTFRLYNTYTDASNYERAYLRWASNVLEIGTEGAGTGSEKPVRITAATLKLPNLPTYADNAAATSGGLVAGDVYKTATGELRITV
jgi:hypothetical protein